MSFAEVKQSIEEMSIEQRLEVAALIVHLNRTDDLEFQGELERRMSAMDSGRKHSAEALKKLNHDLTKQGK